MRYALIMLLLCYNLTLSATTYFIAATGSNSNSGSSSSPWKTLAYAGTKATAAGDIIHVNAGTYTETSQCVLAPGVSIEGDGMATTTILSTVTGSGQPILYLASAQGTNGNQHISGIYFNGNNRTTSRAIRVYGRSNVSIYNCTFINFDQYGLEFYGNANGQAESTSVTYATGNSVHDCIITNCAYYQSGSGGGAAVFMACQTGLEVYNNTITQSRAPYTNGCGVKTDGWTRGVTIYNNTLIGQLLSDKEVADSWDFAIEMWGDVGSVTEGTHIYGNTILNWEIDISGRVTQKGSYAYGCSMHDNFIGCTNLAPVPKHGIQLEANTSLDDILIYRNHFKNIQRGIYIYVTNQTPFPTHFNNFSIYNNIFEQIGTDVNGNGDDKAIYIQYGSGITGFTLSNLKICNNVMQASTRAGSTQEVGIQLACQSGITTSNIEIKNNIIVGFDDACIYTGTSGAINNLSIQNNIFYNNGQSNVSDINITPSPYTISGNLTSDPLFVSSSDFHLQTGSPAIAKGIVISGVTTDYAGNNYNNPPSIGAYESGSAAPVSPVSPVYQAAVVENATPSILKMTYDLNLANIVPAASAFTVLVNSVARAVNTVVVSGTNVQLTLVTPVVYGETVTVSYTKPSVNPVQSSSGGQTETISAKTVINNVNAVIPVYVSSSVENATPTLLEMTYNMSLASIVPAVSSFSVQVNSVARAVNSVAISGTKTQLTLSGPVLYGDIVTVTYVKPSVNPLQSSTGALAVNITAQTVTNRVIAVNPVYVSSSVEKATPAILEITYNMSLANIVPAVSSFSVLVNSTVRTLSTVTISGTKVQLNLVSKVVPGDIVNVSYTKPATNFLQSATGGIASGISKVPVTNNCINIAPTAVLTSPAANSSFTSQSNISMTASASDADGSVNLVEFYSGTTKLGSASALPYSFNWNNVPAGTYSLTVIATDNQNARTVSPAVSISVLDRITTPNKHPIIHIYNPRKGTSYDNLSDSYN